VLLERVGDRSISLVMRRSGVRLPKGGSTKLVVTNPFRSLRAGRKDRLPLESPFTRGACPRRGGGGVPARALGRPVTPVGRPPGRVDDPGSCGPDHPGAVGARRRGGRARRPGDRRRRHTRGHPGRARRGGAGPRRRRWPGGPANQDGVGARRPVRHGGRLVPGARAEHPRDRLGDSVGAGDRRHALRVRRRELDAAVAARSPADAVLGEGRGGIRGSQPRRRRGRAAAAHPGGGAGARHAGRGELVVRARRGLAVAGTRCARRRRRRRTGRVVRPPARTAVRAGR
jgi:hypothetical protein